MIDASQLESEVLDVGKSIGLISDDGSVDTSWFQDPLSRLESILTNSPNHSQRDALLDMLDALLPPEQLDGLAATEKWHPLLGQQTLGNVYLTVNNTNAGVLFGAAGEYHSSGAGDPLARLRVRMPLVSTDGSNLTLVAGTQASPFAIELRLNLGWQQPAQVIGLSAVSVSAQVWVASGTPGASAVITLEQLQLESDPAADVTINPLDPSSLESQTLHLVIGLLRQALSQISGAAGEAAAVIAHLLPLLGFGDPSIPPFPFLTLSSQGVSAIQSWFASLWQGGGTPPIVAWLGHLAGLVGSTSAPTNDGTSPQGPWRVSLLPFGAGSASHLDVVLTQKTTGSASAMLIGAEVVLVPSGANPAAKVTASATIASFPLAGTTASQVLPAASVTLIAPGGAPPLFSNSTITVGSVEAGLTWNGSQLQPLVMLENVSLTIAGTTTPYPQLDLTNADSVVAAVSQTVQNEIVAALGNGVGRHLAALAGFVAPVNDGGTTHLISPALLVTNPAGAIAAVHRAVLLDPIHNWSFMLEELAGLAGIAGAVAGTGTVLDPWHVQITSAGPVAIELAAWNAQTSGSAADPQQLRVGLRAEITSAPIQFEWLAELLAFDLPASGAGEVALIAGQHAILSATPLPSIPDLAGVGVSAAAFEASMDWTPKTSMQWSASLQNVVLTSGSDTVTLPAIKFPPPAGFDVSTPANVAATAASFGITVPNLELLLRMFLVRAALDWGGIPAFTLAGLLGLNDQLPGLQVDWPVLSDPSGAGSLFTNPADALRGWILQLVTSVSSDGSAFLPNALAWLQALLSNALPGTLPTGAPNFNVAIEGSGTYDDPWVLPLTSDAAPPADALAWIEPAGPPPKWATGLIAQATSAADMPSLLSVTQSVAAFLPDLSNTLDGLDTVALVNALSELEGYFSSSDGIVPTSSQIPASGWTTGTTLSSAHPKQPQDSAAISQILTQIDSWAGGAGASRVVLLLGPSFSDHQIWQTLLSDPNLHGTTDPGANFNLRVSGVDPAAVDLSSVTAKVAYYTADLQDDGSGNLTSLVNQIGRVVGQIGQLRGGAKVTLVAHSTSGVPARVFAAANAALVQGLITLGTPHAGASLPFLTDPDAGNAARVLQQLRAKMTGADPVTDALDHILQAMDGYLPAAGAGQLPQPAPYPVSSFNFTGAGDPTVPGLNALALGSTLGGDLFTTLQTAVGNAATGASSPLNPPAAPTHLALGMRGHLSVPGAAASAVNVDAWLRADLFRIALTTGAPPPPRPAHALSARLKLTSPGGWLVGGPSFYAGSGLAPFQVSVRWAELGADIVLGTGLQVNPFLALHQVAWNGPASTSSVFTDAGSQALLGAVLQQIASPAPLAGSPLDQVLSALQSLGIAVADPHGGIGISADAFAALATDATAYLAPRFASAISGASGFLGFVSTSPGQWTLPLGALPLQVYLSQSQTDSTWTAGVRTTPAGSGTLALAGNVFLGFDASVHLPDFKPALSATLAVGSFSVTWTPQPAQLTMQAQPWLSPVVLIPANAGTLSKALNDALPRLLFSSATSAALEALLGGGFPIGPIDSFFSAPGSSASQSSALGNGSSLDASKLTMILQLINSAAGLPAGPGITLPGGLQITASGAGTAASPTTLNLSTTVPIGEVVSISAGVAIDPQMHITPVGNASVTVPLPGGGALPWTGITIAFGAAASGITLAATPQPGDPIQILPTFSGLGSLAAGLEALLPRALDELVKGITALGPPSFLFTAALDVVTAVGIYDSVGGFAAHADKIKALADGNWTAALGLSSSTQQNIATAIAGVFGAGSPFAITAPDSVSASGSLVVWTHTLGGGDAGSLTVGLGWDGSGPTASVGIAGFKLGAGALTIDLNAGYGSGSVQCTADLGVSLQSSLGIAIVPKLQVRVAGNAFTVNFLPLATGTADGALVLEIAPTPGLTSNSDSVVQFVLDVLVPLVADVLLHAAVGELTSPVWPGSSQTVESVLVETGLILKGATPDKDTLVTPLPDLGTLAMNFVVALASSVTIPLADGLTLSLVDEADLYGVRLQGATPEIDIGSFALKILFGASTSWGADAANGLTLFILKKNGGLSLYPVLDVAGFGLELTGADDAPLINTSDFRLGGVSLYSFFHWEPMGATAFSSLGGGLELVQFGIPLGLATSQSGGDNPVASSLLNSNSGSSGGDSQPVNPNVDISAWYWETATATGASGGDSNFHIQIGDTPGQALWIPIHAGFGPIYINQIGVELDSVPSASLLIDGSVSVAGLNAQVDELTVNIPLHYLTSPDHWTLDLQGLAVSYNNSDMTVSGGFLKSPGPPVEYDGMLLIQITEFGFVAVGAYSTPTDGGDTYTSLFIFAGVFITIVIAPFFEIEGFGLGIGYNRELQPPTDLNQIPNFILVAALDQGGALANDPMGELMKIRSQIPAKRGSFWLAVGVRGSVFVLVQVTVVVYVVLDKGFEIGILGLAQMALPSDDTAIVNVELALKARFSTAEGILSIQAQLTDNSWLLSPDCQLTGGFAYFMWFPQHQFVLTLGGYHPAFQKPPQFPDVPRLGYNWSLFGLIDLKGESYFALTNTCVMAGERIECTYGPDWIQVWFTAYVDALISWDPFYYNLGIGISIGATFSIDISIPFNGDIKISMSVSVGATLQISGPPLHGEVSVNFAVGSVTIPFGPDTIPQPPPLPWDGSNGVAQKYVLGGDPNGYATAIHVLTGLLTPEPAGAKPSPGTQDQPWKMGSEFSFQTESRMPAMDYHDFVNGASGPLPDVRSLAINPMQASALTSTHVISLQGLNTESNQWVDIATFDGFQPTQFAITGIVGGVSEAVWGFYPPDQVPAAARTLPAVTGLTIVGTAALEGQSALIPIGTLVDDHNPRPLPFASVTGFIQLQGYGVSADALAQFATDTSTLSTIGAATDILSTGQVFAAGREAIGGTQTGLTPFAVRALTQLRSAPPLLTPITTGLTMKPPKLPLPPTIPQAVVSGIVTLDAPRLRAVLRSYPQPASDVPLALRTTVSNAPPAAVRMAAPVLDTVAGARLSVVAAPAAVRSARLASNSKTLRTPELGWSGTGAQNKALRQAEADFIAAGVHLAAGVTHVWDLPDSLWATGNGPNLTITGNSAIRITCLDLAGAILQDQESVNSQSSTFAIPPKTAMLAVMCLGNPAGVNIAGSGFGRVSLAAAPAGKTPVVGWQAANQVFQAAPLTLLARGAAVVLSQSKIALRSLQMTTQSEVRAADAIGDKLGVETWLPPTISVVMVMLDQQNPTAANSSDLSIAAQGVTLSTSPLIVNGGSRTALLYDVQKVATDVKYVTLSVASLSAWRVAGVVGAAGSAQEWATRMNGGVPEQMVPEGPLTPDGQVTVQLVSPPASGPQSSVGSLGAKSGSTSLPVASRQAPLSHAGPQGGVS